MPFRDWPAMAKMNEDTMIKHGVPHDKTIINGWIWGIHVWTNHDKPLYIIHHLQKFIRFAFMCSMCDPTCIWVAVSTLGPQLWLWTWEKMTHSSWLPIAAGFLHQDSRIQSQHPMRRTHITHRVWGSRLRCASRLEEVFQPVACPEKPTESRKPKLLEILCDFDRQGWFKNKDPKRHKRIVECDNLYSISWPKASHFWSSWTYSSLIPTWYVLISMISMISQCGCVWVLLFWSKVDLATAWQQRPDPSRPAIWSQVELTTARPRVTMNDFFQMHVGAIITKMCNVH